jgi:hypothetical protein
MVLGLALAASIDALNVSIKEGLSIANKGQKSSLKLGLSLNQARERLGGSLDSLRGSIDKRLMIGIRALEAGLQVQTKGTNKLVNQQILTGTARAQTIKTFAALVAIGGAQVDSADRLFGGFVEFSGKYTVSTDLMVRAVTAFSDQFAALNVVGIGESFTGAVAELQAKLGPQFESGLQQVMKLVLQTGTKGIGTLAALGLSDIRDQLQIAGGDRERTLQILQDAIVTAGKNATKMAGGANASLLSLGNIGEALGFQIETLIPLQKQIEKGFRDRNEVDQDYFNQWSVFKSEVLDPVKEAMLSAFTIVLPIGEALFKGLGQAVESLVHRFMNFWINIGGLEGIAKRAVIAWNFVAEKAALFFITLQDVLLKASALLNITPESVSQGALAKGLEQAFGKVLTIGPGGIPMLSDSKDKKDKLTPADAVQNVKDMFNKLFITNKEVENLFRKQTEKDANDVRTFFGLHKEVAENTDAINRKTPDLDTTSQFLDQTNLLLSESIDKILGFENRDNLDLLENMRDSLEAIRDHTGDALDIAPLIPAKSF